MPLKPSYRVILVVIALLTSSVHAQTSNAYWTNGGGDQLWTNPANWDPQGVPLGVHVFINSQFTPAPKITEDVTANKVSIAWHSDNSRDVLGELTIEGGSLTMVPVGVLDGQIVVSGSDWASGKLTIKDGTVSVPRDMDVSLRGRALVNMYGGLLDVEGDFRLSKRSTSDCTVNLYGGVIDAFNVDWTDSSSSFQTMNITGGKLVLEGNDGETIQEGIDKGFLFAYKGFVGGNIVVDYNEVSNVTVVTATYSLAPRPADGSVLLPTDEVELGWTLPEHSIPGQTVRADVYFTDDLQQITDFTDPASMQIMNRKSESSVIVETEIGKTYYWAVDTYIGGANDPVLGPIFSFTIEHAALAVNAGVDVLAVLQDGSVTGPLSGTVTGDGENQSATVKWTVVSEPDPVNAPAIIADPTAVSTTITLTAVGEYEIQLEAFDGKQTKSDILTITVYDEPWIALDK